MMARRLFALLFGIFGAVSVLLMAYARHAGIDSAHPLKQEYLTIAANIMLPHALLGLFALSQFDKIGRFSCATSFFILLGMILFCGGLIFAAFGITMRAPTAPVGGFCFAASWLVIGTGLFAQPTVKNS